MNNVQLANNNQNKKTIPEANKQQPSNAMGMNNVELANDHLTQNTIPEANKIFDGPELDHTPAHSKKQQPSNAMDMNYVQLGNNHQKQTPESIQAIQEKDEVKLQEELDENKVNDKQKDSNDVQEQKVVEAIPEKGKYKELEELNDNRVNNKQKDVQEEKELEGINSTACTVSLLGIYFLHIFILVHQITLE